MTAKWNVLIADDEPAARRGVRQLLAAFPEFTVAGECRNGAEVLAALETSPPDVVFLDIQMPGIDGFGRSVEPLGENARRDIARAARGEANQDARRPLHRLGSCW